MDLEKYKKELQDIAVNEAEIAAEKVEDATEKKAEEEEVVELVVEDDVVEIWSHDDAKVAPPDCRRSASQ